MIETFRHLPLFLFAALYVLTGAFIRPDVQLAGFLGLLAIPLVWLSVTDLARYVIPDAASFCVALLGLLWPVVQGAFPDPGTVVGAVLVAVGLTLAGDFYWRLKNREALGMGDAKLLGAGTLVVGIENLWLLIFLAASGGIVAAIMAQRRREEGIPFGPFIAYAIFAIAALLGGE